MTTASFAELLPDVLPFVAACPEPTALIHIRAAANIFFTKTLAWEYHEENVLAALGGEAYLIPIPDETEVAKVLEVYIDGAVVNPLSKLRSRATATDWRTEVSSPRTYIVPGRGILRLIPNNEIEATISTNVAVAPTRLAESMDMDLMDRYRDAIVIGALSRIMSIPGQMFTDPTGAKGAGVAFANVIGEAKIELTVGDTTAPERVMFNPTVRRR